jgi:hypothetical protein
MNKGKKKERKKETRKQSINGSGTSRDSDTRKCGFRKFTVLRWDEVLAAAAMAVTGVWENTWRVLRRECGLECGPSRVVSGRVRVGFPGWACAGGAGGADPWGPI